MKPVGLIGTGVLLLFLGAVPPTYAQEEKHEQDAKPQKQEEQAKPQKQEQAKPAKEEKQAQAKPEKQEQAKPAKEEKQAKPAKQEKQAQAKPEKQEQAKPTKQEHVQQVKGQQPEQAQGQWARNGQKDSRGHEYNESRFGRDHHARFEENGGRIYNGRREYSYGGYWFYAGVYPPWFYQQEVYFIMGADGLWYAVAYGNPSLMFQVNIE
ncbi:MAG: hypothetical protein WBR26_25675 [Candidatus Acidiferrum sp.]